MIPSVVRRTPAIFLARPPSRDLVGHTANTICPQQTDFGASFLFENGGGRQEGCQNGLSRGRFTLLCRFATTHICRQDGDAGQIPHIAPSPWWCGSSSPQSAEHTLRSMCMFLLEAIEVWAIRRISHEVQLGVSRSISRNLRRSVDWQPLLEYW